MLKSIFSGKNRDVTMIVALLIGFIACYHIGTALKGQARFRDQHLGAALHYAETKISLANTIIPGFNATETPTIQEFPVWQMAVGAAFKLLGTWWGWANIVSLLLFLTCLYPLFQAVKPFYGERIAWWALACFLSQALIFLYAGEAGTDGLCLAAALWFWFAAVRLLDAPGKWFVPAVLFGTLAAVSKLPFFMAVGLASFFLLLKVRGFQFRAIAMLAMVGGLSGIFFLVWTRYTDSLQAGAVFPYLDLRLSAPPTNGTSMAFWYFGDMHYRLNPGNWIKAAWRLGGAAFGSFALIPLCGLALLGRWVNPAGKFLLLGSFVTTLVFTHLILHHYNYLMLFSPAIAILMAAAWNKIEQLASERGFHPRLTTAAIAMVIFLALFQGLMSLRAFSFDKFPDRIIATMREHTAPTDRLIVINGGWGGEELICTGRKGLSMWNAKAFEDPEKYAQLKKLGFNKMVILSESPYQNAIQIVNPGQTGIPRIFAKKFLTPLVEGWPTVYATEDIIIKEIP